ncbi:uncharacterized protein EV422DRAFT_24556 [Fimicolochytrium jonesii]|uniref:uncharacterized protein n=1 Tax=Fimicolochytrium jonesii TaxID=1396493 RepID=UPI0022FE6153|nr:uncharacterized protein EV422DRAFT_24556 [Fimicolochytrium jonesii]KAI8827079.1 hypothetical protein EV422DRAFT_24556 [Fimicolochytrium jonesii]
MPSLILLPATPDHRPLLAANHHAQWGGPKLTLDQYQAKEAELRNTAYCKERLRDWVLVDEEDKETILSSCQTLTLPAVLATPSSPIQHRSTLAIASVHTPHSQRGHGYATTMMKQVMSSLAQTEAGTGASTLYSDIGRSFYARLGWPVTGSCTQGIVEVAHAANGDSSGGLVQNITAETLPRFLDLAVKGIETQVREAATDGKTGFAVLPAADFFEYFQTHARESAVHIRPDIHTAAFDNLGGAISVEKEEDSPFLLWFPNISEEKLYILLIHSPPKSTNTTTPPPTHRLLYAAIAHARHLGLAKVVVWQPEDCGVETFPGMQVSARETSLSSLAIVRGACAGSEGGEVVWAKNEKYAWV